MHGKPLLPDNEAYYSDVDTYVDLMMMPDETFIGMAFNNEGKSAPFTFAIEGKLPPLSPEFPDYSGESCEQPGVDL